MTTVRLVVEVERVSGLFVGRDELTDAIRDAIEEVDLTGLGANGDSEYEVTSVDVELPEPNGSVGLRGHRRGANR